jgi:hypothetical protein
VDDPEALRAIGLDLADAADADAADADAADAELVALLARR